ncbi:hypothetical protein RRG08_031528 [Elysia crispata]|uniref:Uncharacterized protein n=1 Tax=Elysia crispata TaxID=231223 RepID=A0AAE0Z508_9GAST|nr:hypothetical protein RRG08_031528 [Elysia crispata]
MLQGSATYCGSCLSPSSQSIAVFGENGCWIPRQISVKRTKQREREMGDVAQSRAEWWDAAQPKCTRVEQNGGMLHNQNILELSRMVECCTTKMYFGRAEWWNAAQPKYTRAEQDGGMLHS